MPASEPIHLLVLREHQIPVDIGLIRTQTGLDVATNSIPPQEGVAIFDCGREVDWAWPSMVIKAGTCDTGRHHVDVTLGPSDDVTGTVIETIDTIQNSMAETPEEAAGFGES